MSDIYKLQYNGMTLAYPGWNGYVGYEQLGYPITYLSDEHVSVTGAAIYTPGSEGITLDSGYDTYYRISGYDITGGSIVDGKLVPTGPCTIKAVEKANYFTASGDWEKGSDIWAYKNETKNIDRKYAIHTNHTGDIPASWYSTSNRWKPNNASSYSITLDPRMSYAVYNGNGTAYNMQMGTGTGQTLIGDTITAEETAKLMKPYGAAFAIGGIYTASVTTNTQNVNYCISGKFYCHNSRYSRVAYSASLTTGTWTATGIAP